MPSALRAALLGSDRCRPRPSLRLVAPPLCFVVAFAAYATDVFSIAGGVVFVPFDAAALGVVAAVALSYRRDGLLPAWVTVYAALLGYSAVHYFLGLSGRSLAERAAAFLSPDGLVFLGVEALVFGTVAWLVGTVAALAVDRVRERRDASATASGE
ncbi:hypothetical protein C463_03397 [Halorubrum californiense DSM 19288]|uniref:Uncharacterized protein n=1 Tax=Halorubrum californiense DSM 19288 TaxID=1227465 RepID=M0EKG8_9EURY|nr:MULTISPECIES: hypothetical protein [Halorubrum]ELZ46914.1 hypothetical protein C463_03397 [Halorubrum californiense DSM 19288]TKX69984.1 hypothetical protein EXE40_10135 [Halorubrum sp. GN11GM_10-3_MGM]